VALAVSFSFLISTLRTELDRTYSTIRSDVYDGPPGFRTQDMVLGFGGQARSDGSWQDIARLVAVYRGIVHWN
jgi:hypothetical protein